MVSAQLRGNDDFLMAEEHVPASPQKLSNYSEVLVGDDWHSGRIFHKLAKKSFEAMVVKPKIEKNS